MLARYLKAQLIVLVCGGLVGPIFLITYFALPNLLGSFGSEADSIVEQSTSWLLWVGLFITITDVLVALWLANRGAQSSAKMAALQQTGVLATAQIQGLAETGMRINDHPVVKLDLRITGPGVDFTDQKRVTVDFAKQAIVTSRKLVALVDPTTREYEIDWQASALIAGVVPAQITVSEDNKTYDLSGQAGPLMEILQIYKANNLPFGGTVDIRNYPAVRQQVVAVVRRAGEAQQQQPASSVGGGVSERLAELEKLHASGALSDAEYTAARQKILADL
ncbi:SHOCT domain-containing protein [Candidatus Mycobacterium wuenschmannii]|uniref:SHOCT domain-containing protein n=1 Tax=Candidatus Mycobacterium wuenschmannii TaxID=3027808 RepID=A0ABY8VX70_9MYCO|nr:SHOCT domain-containing protein [Candidatus Mycobacterium wuenschmannii]WIM87531.1 SHOCT domain-containing protein [Candidatus Mycobacterium wuenschmannii]